MRGFKEPRIHAVRYCASHGYQKPTRAIIHCTESPNRRGLDDVLAIPGFWIRQGSGYATQLVIDADGNTCRVVDDNKIAWGCGGSNTGSLQIEFIGYSIDAPALWTARQTGLKQGAKWLAHWHRLYGLPLGLSVTHGIATHAMHSAAFHLTDHTDPGRNFPLGDLLRWARYYRAFGWLQNPNN